MTEITTDNTKAPINALERIEVLKAENAKLKGDNKFLAMERDEVAHQVCVLEEREERLEKALQEIADSDPCDATDWHPDYAQAALEGRQNAHD